MSTRRGRSDPAPAPRPAVRTEDQVSAGGVVVRVVDGEAEAAIICVGAKRRWQLPKGLVDEGEAPEHAAAREVREETGIDGELVAPLDLVEYWYVGDRRGERVRFHKRVHFYLFRYRGGSVDAHDHEVLEARWVPLAEVPSRLAFASERRVAERALELLRQDGGDQ